MVNSALAISEAPLCRCSPNWHCSHHPVVWINRTVGGILLNLVVFPYNPKASLPHSLSIHSNCHCKTMFSCSSDDIPPLLKPFHWLTSTFFTPGKSLAPSCVLCSLYWYGIIMKASSLVFKEFRLNLLQDFTSRNLSTGAQLRKASLLGVTLLLTWWKIRISVRKAVSISDEARILLSCNYF